MKKSDKLIYLEEAIILQNCVEHYFRKKFDVAYYKVISINNYITTSNLLVY